MSTRDVRDLIVKAWTGKLHQAGCKHPHTLALELAAITEAHGVKLTRPAHLHDPAADWTTPTQPTPPTDDWHAARQALRGPHE